MRNPSPPPLGRILAALLAALPCVAPADGIDPPLRSLPGARNLLIGAAAMNDFWDKPDSAQYEQALGTIFNALTPENQLKWQGTEPRRGEFTLDGAARHVAFAKQHSMVVHGHTLVWHSGVPEWLENTAWTRADLIGVMSNHIAVVVGRFKDDIAIWDVVNEAINDNGSFRDSFWNKAIGDDDRDGIPDYIALAFRFARAADRDCILVYNDYGAETPNAKSDAILKMAKDLRRKGVPLDAVGFQNHIHNLRFDAAAARKNLRRFAAAGLQIYFTETDYGIQPPVTPIKLETQARLCRELILLARDIPAVKGVFWWGFTDKHSWLNMPKFGGGRADGLLLDRSYAPKPCYTAVQQALK